MLSFIKEWEEIGQKVEIKVMHKLKAWTEYNDKSDDSDEWYEVGGKVEQKLQRKIREWAEKE